MHQQVIWLKFVCLSVICLLLFFFKWNVKYMLVLQDGFNICMWLWLYFASKRLNISRVEIMMFFMQHFIHCWLLLVWCRCFEVKQKAWLCLLDGRGADVSLLSSLLRTICFREQTPLWIRRLSSQQPYFFFLSPLLQKRKPKVLLQKAFSFRLYLVRGLAKRLGQSTNGEARGIASLDTEQHIKCKDWDKQAERDINRQKATEGERGEQK